jgi:hypothetical protein
VKAALLRRHRNESDAFHVGTEKALSESRAQFAGECDECRPVRLLALALGDEEEQDENWGWG